MSHFLSFVKTKAFKMIKNYLCLIKQPSASDLVKGFSYSFLYYYYFFFGLGKCLNTKRGLWKYHTISNSTMKLDLTFKVTLKNVSLPLIEKFEINSD